MFGIEEKMMGRVIEPMLYDSESSRNKKLIIIVGNSSQQEVAERLEKELQRTLKKSFFRNSAGRAECVETGYVYNIVHAKHVSDSIRGLKVGEVIFVQ